MEAVNLLWEGWQKEEAMQGKNNWIRVVLNTVY